MRDQLDDAARRIHEIAGKSIPELEIEDDAA
jgi:hypothetical protein